MAIATTTSNKLNPAAIGASHRRRRLVTGHPPGEALHLKGVDARRPGPRHGERARRCRTARVEGDARAGDPSGHEGGGRDAHPCVRADRALQRHLAAAAAGTAEYRPGLRAEVEI